MPAALGLLSGIAVDEDDMMAVMAEEGGECARVAAFADAAGAAGYEREGRVPSAWRLL